MAEREVKRLMRGLHLRFLMISVVLVVAAVTGNAQKPRPTPLPPILDIEKPESRADLATDASTEMRTNMALKAEQKGYDENLARAREASELGTQVLDAYKTNKTIGAPEAKKLERLEKLTKKIRSEAGGLNTEEQEPDPPGTLETAIKRVADLAGELRKDVEKTPKHVISTVVIERANNLIGLVQQVRKLLH